MTKLGWPSETVLKRTNRVLLAIIILINSYVLLAPLLPRVEYEVKTRITKPVSVNPASESSLRQIDRSRDHLILPSLQLDEPVYFGSSPSLVHKGIWHRPQTTRPGQGGNTVLVGHRFTYDGAAVFYSLDKLRPGDDIYFVYDQKIYHYRTKSSAVVQPTAGEVEAPTSNTQLTLYTCTPLITAANRLVYVADLVEVL